MKITYEVTSIEIDGYLVQYNCGYATTDLDDAIELHKALTKNTGDEWEIMVNYEDNI